MSGQDDQLTVGQIAALLGLSPSTLRAWERRYGLSASARTSGGHRRYTHEDVARLRGMRAQVVAGRPPARAAFQARADSKTHTGPADGGTATRGRRAGSRGGPGGRVLAVPSGTPAARGLARAVSALDEDAAATIIEGALARDGVLRSWDELVLPVLVAAGSHWARTGAGIEVEHLLTEVTMEALRHHRRSRPRPRPAAGVSPVLLAGAPGDLHSLPLYALSAVLSQWGVTAHMLGPRVPAVALFAAARRRRARAVFIWAQLPPEHEFTDSDPRPMRPRLQVVVGGPGWHGLDLPPDWTLAASLAEAATALGAELDPAARS